jgi:hypothetical protein
MKIEHVKTILFGFAITIVGLLCFSCKEVDEGNKADEEFDSYVDRMVGFTISSISRDTEESGTQATFTVKLKSQPSGNVSIGVSSSDIGEGVVSVSNLTFTSNNWNTNQTVAVTGVDDGLVDGNQFFKILLAPATGNDTNYNGLDPSDVSVTNIDINSISFNISPISGNTTESGEKASFTAKMNSRPTSDVTIALSSSDIGEGTISSSSLTFTSVNWNANQTVTVAGVDDDLIDGNQIYFIILGDAASADNSYDGLDIPDVSVTNIDNNSISFNISSISGNTTESGGTAFFTMKLNSPPTNDVTIALSSSDIGEGTVSPSSLTFTPINWNIDQNVIVAGVNDDLVDGNQSYNVILSSATSADIDYNELDPNDVSLINTDNDSAGITVSSISGNTSEDEQIATFTVVLNSEPTANVIISVSSSDTSEGIVSPSVLSFIPGNWSVNQTVSVTGVNDDLFDGDQPFHILLSAASSTDSDYNGLDPNDITLINDDNEPTRLLPDSGQSTSYTNTFGEDADYSINSLSFTDNSGDGTVTDNNTWLMWQKEDDNTKRSWSDARIYCSNMSLAGYSNWRLPNPKEFQSILNYEAHNPPIDLTVFPNTNYASYSGYWTSTTFADNTSEAWYIFFFNGYLGGYATKTESLYVRCVRGDNTDIWPFDYTDNNDGTISHGSTNLMWQKEDDDTIRDWELALGYCEGLNLGGYTDWRLPNVKELPTIIDYESVHPSVDLNFFPNTNYDNFASYWTSTSSANDAGNAWALELFRGGGFVTNYGKYADHYVRCVRGGQ